MHRGWLLSSSSGLSLGPGPRKALVTSGVLGVSPWGPVGSREALVTSGLLGVSVVGVVYKWMRAERSRERREEREERRPVNKKE